MQKGKYEVDFATESGSGQEKHSESKRMMPKPLLVDNKSPGQPGAWLTRLSICPPPSRQPRLPRSRSPPAQIGLKLNKRQCCKARPFWSAPSIWKLKSPRIWPSVQNYSKALLRAVKKIQKSQNYKILTATTILGIFKILRQVQLRMLFSYCYWNFKIKWNTITHKTWARSVLQQQILRISDKIPVITVN